MTHEIQYTAFGNVIRWDCTCGANGSTASDDVVAKAERHVLEVTR